LDSDQAPTGLEREFEIARTARNDLLTAQLAATDRHSSLRTMQSSQGLRIGIGYACIFLIISSIAWAARSASKSVDSVMDSNLAGTNDGGFGNNSALVPELIPNQVPVNQQSTCQNCFGTGQSDCVQCAGTGKRSCFMCNGTGRAVNNLQCFQCNGTGRQNCSFCSFGKVQCPQCFGTGKH
jgi:hypothetical protein